MKAYIIATIHGQYMIPAHDKIYKSKNVAQKKCNQINEERQETNKAIVLCADNWYEEKEAPKS